MVRRMRDKYGRFVKGSIPYMKGKKHSEETKRKIRKSKQERPYSHTEETKNKMSLERKSRKYSEEHKQNLSLVGRATRFQKGNIPWNIGKEHTKEANEKNRLAHLGKKLSEETKKKMSLVRKGKKFSEKHRRNLSLAQLGEKNHNWRNGGNSPYPTTWTNDLREAIRKRDNHLCQVCFKSQEELDRELAVHHIDYDKDNLNPFNLISLCVLCHAKTGSNRIYWEQYFNEQMKERGLDIWL